MNVMRIPRFVSITAIGLVVLSAPPAHAQQPATPAQAAPVQPPTPRVARIVADPANPTLVAGQPIAFKLTAYDSAGNVIENPPLRSSGPRGVLRYSNGQLTGMQAGKYEVVVTAVGGTNPTPDDSGYGAVAPDHAGGDLAGAGPSVRGSYARASRACRSRRSE